MIATATPAPAETVTPSQWFGGIPEWFGEFFGALPEAGMALYEFGDPGNLGRGWWGILIVLIWGVFLIGLPLLVAKRTAGEREWVAASMGVLAGLSVLWWIFGVLPSAWIYYLDSTQEILEGTVIPASVGYTLQDSFLWFPAGYRFGIDTFTNNFYLVVRDSVVVLMHVLGFMLMFRAARKVQERYPRGLSEGEVKSDPGGYR